MYSASCSLFTKYLLCKHYTPGAVLDAGAQEEAPQSPRLPRAHCLAQEDGKRPAAPERQTPLRNSETGGLLDESTRERGSATGGAASEIWERVFGGVHSALQQSDGSKFYVKKG